MRNTLFGFNFPSPLPGLYSFLVRRVIFLTVQRCTMYLNQTQMDRYTMNCAISWIFEKSFFSGNSSGRETICSERQQLAIRKFSEFGMRISTLSNSETNLKQCRLTQFQHILCRKGSGQSSRKLWHTMNAEGGMNRACGVPEPVGALPLVGGAIVAAGRRE